MTRRVLLLETTLLSFVAVAVLLAGALATLAGTAWSSVTSGSRRGGVTCVSCRVTTQYALVNVRNTQTYVQINRRGLRVGVQSGVRGR